jgi:uncharacterized phage protein (TIGR02216 family)
MAFGLGVLRLSPDAFWRMTLKEFSAVGRGMMPAPEKLGRQQFAELMLRYPDK